MVKDRKYSVELSKVIEQVLVEFRELYNQTHVKVSLKLVVCRHKESNNMYYLL